MPLFFEYPHWLSPEIIPGLPLRWYGLMYLVAFSLAYLLTRVQLRDQRFGVSSTVSQDDLVNLFFWTILGLLVGARIFAALVYDTSGRYLSRPWLIFWPFNERGVFTGLQGMSYHGGLLGAVAGFVTYAKLRKIDVLEMGDLLVTAIPLGYTFGRIGNFINGELYGRVTARPWGVRFPQAQEVPARHPAVQEIAARLQIDLQGLDFVNLPRHPSQLYEAALEGVVLWAILWFVFRHRKPFKGFMIGLYLIGYALARFVAEYFRVPDSDLGFVIQAGPENNPGWLFLSPLNITTGQVLSILMALAGVALLLLLWGIGRRAPRVQTFQEAPEHRRNARRQLRRKLNRR
ncbi:phosphatidylglycerol:prolipoprotein diacylglycerol transferase [Alkalispirochaeta americana]|uniref:Phosphatidylglycerol--prolipoprotein diacylglyceryl transferase n=1 Tax=Alkalispirochaeta americana TaxID=159291 RepID=A0A1N6RZG1_9SPIO|nr:prolipoprotein diacylglyceryl transferase [Alkalispirochaeta americana]SIQ34240.1 phosphatidylglycerol:prolipoprotein diacylglycerol transferase [Alkalispirochaeta americana]